MHESSILGRAWLDSLAWPAHHALRRQHHLHRSPHDDDSLIILDAGTGIFPLAQQLLKQLPVQANIFMTHTHWDHIQGLPFFTPLYIPGNSVRIHGGFDIVSGRGVEQIMEVQLQYSYFPVREAEMKAAIDYVTLNAGEPIVVGDATVTPLMLNHPVVNFGYRIDCGGKSVFFTGDHEPWGNIYAPDDDELRRVPADGRQQQAQLDSGIGRARRVDCRQFLHPGRVPGQGRLGPRHAGGPYRLGAPAGCQETGVHPPRARTWR
jgi:phosphoribosyl 1,2-cyclic phosphodiesterase